MSQQNGFPLKLVRLRADAGMTQRDLAAASGISVPQIGRYEAGISRPRMTALVKLAKALGVEPEALQGDDEAGDVELMFDVNFRDFGKMRCSLHFSKSQHAKLTQMYEDLDEKGRVDLLGGLLKKATLESDIYVEEGRRLIPQNDEITGISARFINPQEKNIKPS